MGSEDRLRGALLGLAVGDALGAAVEFKPPGTFTPVDGYRAGGPHGLNVGEWTDDTSMALALADSLAQAGWDLNDQAERYVSWWQKGRYSVNGRCFDIGITTSGALRRFQQKRDARASGDTSDRASGNGSIMRLAPVVIRNAHLFPDQLDELARLAAESSLPTHASEQCLSACRYMAVLVAGLAHGLDREEVLDPRWKPLQGLRSRYPLHQAIEEVAAGSFRLKSPPEIVGSGYVVKSLEAALWAFAKATNYREAVLSAANLGDDADTTGAVCGQFAGAHWGESGIPAEWLSALARRDLIEAALSGLLNQPTRPQSTAPLATNTPPATSWSYWVVPGQLLAGAYPGSLKPKEHGDKVRALLDAGIQTFINLTLEDETGGSGKPFVAYQETVRKLAEVSSTPVSCLRFAIKDQGIPSAGLMREILDSIDKSIGAARPVYLHCWGGVGRTGTTVGCWLLRHGHATKVNVLTVLKQLRFADKERGHRPAPENEVQRAFVMNWREIAI